eukprot:10977141-Alexandrium_andersonii.AAC.1
MGELPALRGKGPPAKAPPPPKEESPASGGRAQLPPRGREGGPRKEAQKTETLEPAVEESRDYEEEQALSLIHI